MKYTAPEMNVVLFETEEVIVASAIASETPVQPTQGGAVGGDED